MNVSPVQMINVKRNSRMGNSIPTDSWTTCVESKMVMSSEKFAGVKFIKNSANGLYFITGNSLYKVQIEDYADNIAAEAVNLKVINDFEKSRSVKLFPEFREGFVMKGPITYIDKLHNDREVTVNNLFRVLHMEAFLESSNLIEYLDYIIKSLWKSPNNQQIATMYSYLSFQLSEFLLDYGKVSKALKMTHNDMGLQNILVTGGKWKVIDCGRVYIPMIQQNGLLKRDDIRNMFDRLCVQLSPSIFVNEFHIQGKYNYLCDLLTVCLNVLPILSYFVWPLWCQYYKKPSEGGRTCFWLSYNLLFTHVRMQNVPLHPTYYILAWFVCCLNAYNCCVIYLSQKNDVFDKANERNKKIATLDNMLEYFRVTNVKTKVTSPLDYNILDNEIVWKVLSENIELGFDDMRRGILLSNNGLNPAVYDIYVHVAERLFDNLGLVDPFVDGEVVRGGSSSYVDKVDFDTNYFKEFIGNPKIFMAKMNRRCV